MERAGPPFSLWEKGWDEGAKRVDERISLLLSCLAKDNLGSALNWFRFRLEEKTIHEVARSRVGLVVPFVFFVDRVLFQA